MNLTLANLIQVAGILHLSILLAAAIVPKQLDWKHELAGLQRLHRQMYWTYAGYIVLAIIAFAIICLTSSAELAAGNGLARVVCAYIAVFWGVRLLLQMVFDVRKHLTRWWLALGYRTLTVLFASLTCIFAYAALHSG